MSDAANRHERAKEGVEHLQQAALEMIEAARAFLDVAEDVVRDPNASADAWAAVAHLAETAAQRAQGHAATRRQHEDEPTEGARVQRIRIS